jgi:hypothetical protein
MDETNRMRLRLVRPINVEVPSPDLDFKVLTISPDIKDKIVNATMSLASKKTDELARGIMTLWGVANNPTYVKQIQKRAEAYLERYIPLLRESNPIGIFTYVVASSPFYGTTEQKRLEILRMLTIMMNESKFQPQAANYVDSQGKVYSSPGPGRKLNAYGYMQHTAGNWNSAVINFQNTEIGKWMNKTGLTSRIASTLRIKPSDLTKPVTFRTVGSLPEMQIVPMLNQFNSLYKGVRARFAFTGGRWQPISSAVANKPMWLWAQQTFKDLLSIYEGGLMVLYTLSHLEGLGWASLSKLGNGQAIVTKRVLLDCRTFASMLTTSTYDTIVDALGKKWNFATGTGDIDDPIYGVSSIGTKYLLNDPTSPEKRQSAKIKGEFKPERKPQKTGEHTHTNPGHFGIDLKAARQPVYAIQSGVIVATGVNLDKEKGRGRWVEIKHDSPKANNWKSRYLHLDSTLPGIVKGATVAERQQLGIAGDTGATNNVHLHLEVIDPQGVNRNPLAADVPLDPYNAL